MDQVNRLSGKDPMSKSWENDDMVIQAWFANISRSLIQSGITSANEAVALVQNNFQGDEKSIFPIIFNIELCKLKQKEENSG